MSVSTGLRQRIDQRNAEARETAQAARRRAIYRSKVLAVARRWLEAGVHPREAASKLGCCPDWLLRKM